MRDNGIGVDAAVIGAGIGVTEHAKWQPKWTIEKYDGNMILYELEEINGNLLLTEGISEFMKAACGIAGAIPFSNANSYIGAGDGTTAAEASQPGLLGANKTYAPMDATFPQVSGNTMFFRATFGPTVGNHAWREFTIANGNSDIAKNLNRKVETAARQKVEPDTWVIQLIVSIT